MKKFWVFLFVLLNMAFGKILLDINVGGGVRNINQKVDLYYLKSSSIGSTKVEPMNIKFDGEFAPFFHGKLGIPLVPTLEFKYLEYTLHASLSGKLNFHFGNIEVNDVESNVTLEQDTKELDLDIYYSIPLLGFLKLGVGTNILYAKLNASASFSHEKPQFDTFDLILPIFYVFSALNYEKDKFVFDIKFRYFPKVSVEGYNIEYLSISPQIGYKIFSLPTLDLVTYANYAYSRLKIEKEPDSDGEFYFDRKNNNFEIGGYLNFGF